MPLGIVKVISSAYDKTKRLVVKALFMGTITDGKGDIREPLEVSSFGIDSNPTPDKRGLYTTTTTIGKYYIIGYLNTNRKSAVGETRIFSTDSVGAFKYNIWLKSDGKALMGTSDDPEAYANFAVKFNELKTEFNELKSKYNALVSTFNAHVHVVSGIFPGVGVATVAVPASPGSSSTANIDNAKNADIKYN